MRISVVIPVRDDAEALARCLDALARQARPADEIVVVDGGSADGSDALAHKGLVQHCSVVDFSLLFERRRVLSLDFIRMLVPGHRRRGVVGGAARALAVLRREARFLSPIEWLAPGFPPVLVTTSERDYFYRANLNFLDRLRAHRIPAEALIYERAARNAVHTWQQDARHAESQEVYRRLQRFVASVTERRAHARPSR